MEKIEKTVYVFLAEGFEEMEAVSPTDMLRRAGIPVVLVGVSGKYIKGGQGIVIEADIDGSQGFTLPDDALAVVLPGGMKGPYNLAKSEMVAEVLREAHRRGIVIGLLCFASMVPYNLGLLDGKRITTYPIEWDKLPNAIITGTPLEVDGNIYTCRSPGTAFPFACLLLTALAEDKEAAENVIRRVYPNIW